MKPPIKSIIKFVPFGVFVAVMIFAAWLMLNGVSVKLLNRSAAPISEIHIKYRGGEFYIPRLKAGSKVSRNLVPMGATDIQLYYLDAKGMKHSKQIDVYLEHGYVGSITITIQPDGTIVWTNQSKSHYLSRI